MTKIPKPTTESKFKLVINKNTFYLYDRDFEEKYEGYISSIRELLLILRNKVSIEGLKKDFFVELIRDKENGLRALLALTGISNEYLKRLITLIRVIDDEELNKLTLKSKWQTETEEISESGVSEWSDSKIAGLIKDNENFAKGIVNIFFEGSSVPVLTQALPLFELKKLSVEKLEFKIESLVDTLIRYKEKGSYAGKKENNPEVLIEKVLDELEIPYVSGDLKKLVGVLDEEKRTMDFIIPNQENPLLIIESSYVVTTSSGQGDKAKTEINVARLIKKYYPKALFIGFVDGIGWYVRKNDLKRMVGAYDDVFTFHKEELNRFKDLLSAIFGK
ncbi:MAG TPA: DpnII family type II restriction endonuclease [Anaerohalosphaeraceae bacterium]|nr:DpnII family type II restriction endonuclease [Anaerohalosphaeraceae bacterium]HOL32261.1 DpnII family type II restriction endonuclease [Anaerohalosphaeraceae bacterium]HOM75981.1 DpnII family type II restriction endonuclease [Anaerohalosphaeraceae bacterium]HPC63778.1 DpnII family type II restriction endonuclease [Anaerohalosphaeraceae bacterium]HPO69843.1 DpnII family type II restriction endonuclease [Anaerohalosphaeraceae bacterium]